MLRVQDGDGGGGPLRDMGRGTETIQSGCRAGGGKHPSSDTGGVWVRSCWDTGRATAPIRTAGFDGGDEWPPVLGIGG
jgi:hypothetical protein